MELDVLDKKHLSLFDKDLNRYTLYLKDSRSDVFKSDASVNEFRGYADKLRERLKPVKQQDHPDVKVRQAKIAEYEALLDSKISSAAALAGDADKQTKNNQKTNAKPELKTADPSVLSNDDKHRLGRIEGELKTEQKTLDAHNLTVLGSGGGDGTFHQMSNRLHGFFDAIVNKEHADVKKLAEQLSAYDRVLDEKTRLSKEKLAEINMHGDVKTAVMKYVNDFAVSAFPPQLGGNYSDEDIRTWAVSVKEWQKKLDEVVPYFTIVRQWAPVMTSDVDLRNRVQRFLTERPRQLAEVLSNVIENWKADTGQALAIKPEEIAKDTLVNGAGEELRKISAGIKAAKNLSIFNKASGSANSGEAEKTAAALEAKEKKLGELTVKAGEDFIADARIPEAVDEPELLKIAQSLIKEPYERLVVTRGIRQTTGEVVQGSFIYATDCDIFWAAAVHKLEDGSYRIWDYSFCYSRKGPPGTTFNEWVMDENWGGRKILKENIGK